jgi:hypothetical protein
MYNKLLVLLLSYLSLILMQKITEEDSLTTFGAIRSAFTMYVYDNLWNYYLRLFYIE